MKQTLVVSAAIAAMMMPGAFAQVPDGKDIATAIPYAIGQVVTGIGDSAATPRVVYAVKLAKGQSINIAADKTSGYGLGLALLTPQAVTWASARNPASGLADDKGCCGNSNQIEYLVPATGTYYVGVHFEGTATGYQMTIKANGTPINIPNPPSAGCLSGRVDYITYSLQQIAAGLPDEFSVGGTRACATCTTKPPLYPEIASRLESALKLNVNVEACYDSAGNIFQIKLVRQ